MILIIDDDDLVQNLLRSLLKREALETRFAANGTSGIKHAFEKLPALIICDVNLPDMSGYDVCRTIKANPQTQHIPIIILSAFESSPDERDKAFDAGAAAYVTKVNGWKNLIARVHELLRDS